MRGAATWVARPVQGVTQVMYSCGSYIGGRSREPGWVETWVAGKKGEKGGKRGEKDRMAQIAGTFPGSQRALLTGHTTSAVAGGSAYPGEGRKDLRRFNICIFLKILDLAHLHLL